MTPTSRPTLSSSLALDLRPEDTALPSARPRPHRLPPSMGARALDDLALRAQRGDQSALSLLLERLLVRLRPLVRHHVATYSCDVLTETDIDDILQEVVLIVWQQDLHRFDPSRSAFLTFVSRRLRWHLADRARVARRRITNDLHDMDLEQLVDPASHPEALLETRRGECVLLALPRTVACAHVDAQARHAVQRHDLDGVSLTDVARELDVHVSNACRARQRGLRQLAEHLALAA